MVTVSNNGHVSFVLKKKKKKNGEKSTCVTKQWCAPKAK